ncbi:putative nucleotidyltransferase, Ribonuclease H [Helianthus debilis subsp. tardiflorus]
METRSNTRLDTQDAQIKQLQTVTTQLQSDVAEIRNSFKAFEAERSESSEFRKVVLSWMAKQEKKVDSLDSGDSVVFTGFGTPPGPSSTSDSPLPWAVKKVKLPEFSGFDPQGWIQKANLYFDLNRTSDDARLQLARLSIVGVAQHWFTVILQVHPTISWLDFQSELLQRFSGLEIQNPYEQLATIKQGDSIYDYIDDFEYLLSLVPRLPESQSVGYFVAGLKDDVKKWVRLHRPQSRLDAMYLAKDVELMLRPNSGQAALGRFRYLNPIGPPISGLKDGSSMMGRTESRSMFPFRPGDKSGVPKLDSLRATANPKSSFSVTDLGQNSPCDRGMRSLSRTEWEDRRKKGLCFRCGQQYGPTHRCPEAKLRVLLLGEDEEDFPLGDQCVLQPDSPPPQTIDSDVVTGTCNALEFAGTIAEGSSTTMKLEGSLMDLLISMLVDSGASHNFISRRLVTSLGLSSSKFSGIKIKLGDGHFVLVYERCIGLPVRIGPCLFTVDALVFDTGSLDFILGLEWLKSLGEVVHDWQHSWMRFDHQGRAVTLQGVQTGQSSLSALHQWLSMDGTLIPSSTTSPFPPISPLLTSPQQSSLSFLIHQFADIFIPPSSLPPTRSHDHTIQLSSPTPICVRPYRYPHIQKAEIERQVQELLQMGMIRPSQSAFSSPVILVRKKDNSWRMCVDYRALNNATIPNKYPIPVVDELLDELHGSTFFSKLDLKSGYNQIRMSPDSIDKTAFRTHDGHYEYLVMPFGLMNAPATFQAVMNDIFRPLLRHKVVIFFDDILIHSPSWETHLTDLEEVFQILHSHHFKANPTKCSLGQRSIDYLGHVIDGQGVSMDPAKVSAVAEWPIPTTLKALRGLLGLTGYYRKFVKNYGSIARPLTNLTKKDAFLWSPEAQVAFDHLKQALISAPVLSLPDFSIPFVVECDASGCGIGAVLMQHNKPIAYFSKALSDRNLTKSAYERELMALVLAVQHWRPYLLGSKFTVCTDQKSLKFLLQQRVSSYDQQNWVVKLLGYDFDIQYKPGRENRAADALSRRADSGQFLQAVSSPIWLHGAVLIEEATQDSELQSLRAKVEATPTNFPGYTLKHNTLFYQDRLVISRHSKFIPALLHEFHVTATGGHSGFYRTYRRLAANVYWPGMTTTVKQYIRACDICQRCKASSVLPGGLLQPLAIPEAIWEDLSMDFIVGLPPSKGFTVVLVVVDRLSKYAHFILLKHPYTAKSVAEVFVKEVIRHHGVPKSIVSDRDPLFISKFWQEIFRSMGTKLNMSSAYHPESDGQTEVINRCLESYLRCFAVDQPKTWSIWLPWAEFWYNSTFHASTGVSPFETVYGRRPPSVFQFIPGEIRVDSVAKELQDRDEALKQLKVHLSNSQSAMKLQADKKRRDVNLAVGEWVYVKLKPYRQLSVTSRIHQKLAAKFFGPFQIVEKIGPVAYKLLLPATSKIHPVFHVSLLKKAVSGSSETVLPPELDMAESLHPLPQIVLATRVVRDGSDSVEQWLVHWIGQSADEASWEDAEWVKLQFPDFSLGDKTALEGEGSDTKHGGTKELIVYSRRGKVQSG